jgi:hypothetical protein
MNNTQFSHSAAWISFTYANALAAVSLVLGGIFFLPLDLWIKGYLVMGVAMLISSVTILTKTMRDVQESGKLVNKIEEARTEKLLASIKG